MTMNADNICKRLEAKAEAKAKAKAKEKAKERRDIIKALAKMEKMLPKLGKYRRILNSLEKVTHCDRLFADGIDHNVGFSYQCGNLFGVFAGGVCGLYHLFIDINSGMWTTRSNDIPIDENADTNDPRNWYKSGKVTKEQLADFIVSHSSDTNYSATSWIKWKAVEMAEETKKYEQLLKMFVSKAL